MLDAALPRIRTEGLVALGLAEAGGPGLPPKADLRPYGWDPPATEWRRAESGWPATSPRTSGPACSGTTTSWGSARRPPPWSRPPSAGTGRTGPGPGHRLRHPDLPPAAPRGARHRHRHLRARPGLHPLQPAAQRRSAAHRSGRPEDRVSLRLGSLLEPVAGEAFDLVVSNPPFVITPRTAARPRPDQFTYRDGGLPGDDIVASLVRVAARRCLRRAERPSFWATGRSPRGRRGTNGRKAGPVRTRTRGSSSASRWGRSSTPRPGCRMPPKPGTAGTTRTPTPPTWTTSPRGMSAGSASA